MPVSDPRNRVVIFRLTQEEYQSLRQACSAKGARSLSDFARSKVLSDLHPPEPALADIQRRLDELGDLVHALQQKLVRA